MAAKKKKTATSKALDEPRTTCPFGGQPLRFSQVASGEWQVSGRGWVSTRLFQHRELAEKYFSYSDGLPPTFKTSFERIEVTRHETIVPEAAVDGVTPDVDRALKAGAKLASDQEEILLK